MENISYHRLLKKKEKTSLTFILSFLEENGNKCKNFFILLLKNLCSLAIISKIFGRLRPTQGCNTTEA